MICLTLLHPHDREFSVLYFPFRALTPALIEFLLFLSWLTRKVRTDKRGYGALLTPRCVTWKRSFPINGWRSCSSSELLELSMSRAPAKVVTDMRCVDPAITLVEKLRRLFSDVVR
jgi:hypothetical protein